MEDCDEMIKLRKYEWGHANWSFLHCKVSFHVSHTTTLTKIALFSTWIDDDTGRVGENAGRPLCECVANLPPGGMSCLLVVPPLQISPVIIFRRR